jgi:hypothetical protein
MRGEKNPIDYGPLKGTSAGPWHETLFVWNIPPKMDSDYDSILNIWKPFRESHKICSTV